MDYISTLINTGADAMTNMYEVRFTLPTDITGADEIDVQAMTVRTSGFTPPTPVQTKYPVHWKSVSVDKPGTKIDMTRGFPVTIRLDAYYRIYKLLLAWHALTAVPSSGYASNLLTESNTGGVTVKALDTPVKVGAKDGADGMNETTVDWAYKNVWIESITPPTYASNSTEPATVTVNFVFGEFSDPQKNAYKTK